MNKTTLSGNGRARWARRARAAGLTTLALIGAAGIGTARGVAVERPALSPASTTLVAPASPQVSERFRVLKVEQAEQRANPGMAVPVQAISERYRKLKTRQVEQQLEATAPAASSPAASSARQRFAAMKDQQAMERDANGFVAPITAPVSDHDRALKIQQIDAMLGNAAPAVSRSNVSDQYRTLKEQQVEHILRMHK